MKKILLIGLLLAIIASCVNKIEFDPPTTAPDTIVVSGEFTNSADRQRVFITRPNPFGTGQFAPVEGAAVFVMDDAGNQSQYFSKTKTGVTDPDFCYELPANTFVGVPGKSYFLEIKLPNGQVYRSNPTVMPALVKGDSVQAIGSFYNPGVSSVNGNTVANVGLRANMTIPNDNKSHYLRWSLYRVYHLQEFYRDPTPPKTQTFCFVHDFFDKQTVNIRKFEGQGGQHFSVPVTTRQIDKTYEVMNYFSVIQHSITPDAYKYWEQISQVSNPQGTVFDPPPSPVRGNIYNINDAAEIPFGYFEVAAVDTIRKKLVTTDLGSGFAAPRYCEYTFPDYVAPGPECWCCKLAQYSDYKKPWYWQY